MTKQATSIDPGNIPDGLFWTIPVPPGSVAINPGAGKASFKLDDVALEDFGTIINDFKHGPSVPATASFSVQWSEVVKRLNVRNAEGGFAGEFVVTKATIEFTASVPAHNFEFVSDAAATSTSDVAIVGHERNGVFFPEGAKAAKKHRPAGQGAHPKPGPAQPVPPQPVQSPLTLPMLRRRR